MAIGLSNGMPIRAVFGVHQLNPMVIISRSESPVRSPKELEGRVIAMAPSESTAQIFPALLTRNNVDASKISVLNPAVGAKNALLIQNRTDAVTGVTYFALPIFERQNVKVETFAYQDFGVPGLESGIVVNTTWLEQNQDLLRRFLRATTKAWQMARQDPAAAVNEALSIRKDRERDRDLLLAQLRLGLELLSTPNTAGLPFGAMAEQDWRAMIEVLTSTGQIKQTLPIERYFTNDHVPQ
jgi:NitT/TauT family transport system substrate-binding protein